MKSCQEEVKEKLWSIPWGSSIQLSGISDALLVIAAKLDKIEAALLIAMERK